MKVAIIASNQGEKAIYLHDFFKEGNRITIDCLLTNNPSSPIAERMRQEGIEVIHMSPALQMDEVVRLLRMRGVELLVVDDFEGEMPEELRQEFGEAVVYPQGRESAPLEVIATTDRLKAAANAALMPQQQSPGGEKKESADDGPSSIEEEWAEVLEIEIKTDPKDNETAPPENPQPPAYPGTPPPYYNQQPPQYQQPEPPRYEQQPPAYKEPERMPDTYLVWSVVLTILCCLIPGIIAIIYSASVSSKYYAGDIEGSKRASRNAQIWCIISVIAGIIWATLYVPLVLFLS